MKTLPQNYSRNVDILKENIKRGMKLSQCNNAIAGLESQFINANKYGKDEKNFINEMRKTVINSFTNLSVNII